MLQLLVYNGLTWDQAQFSFRQARRISAVAVRAKNVWEPLKLGLISGYNGSLLKPRFKDFFWFFGLPLQSFQLSSFTKCFRIEGYVKKTSLEQICEWSVVLWKIPSRTSLAWSERSAMGKHWLHFTQAQLNWYKDFVIPVFYSSRASVAGSFGQG